MKTILVKFSRSHQAEPACHLIADCHCGNELATRTIVCVRDGKRRRNDRAARMKTGFQMRVIEFKHKRRGAVDKRGTRHGRLVRKWD
ncbi:MAG: hypothetical protein Q7V40_08385 [Pseudolabrys sp.]|nr:hypothetical protein [Pseudolabrys sp.]